MTKAKTVAISMPEALANQLDKLCSHELRSRSEVVRDAIREYLERRKAAAKRRTS